MLSRLKDLVLKYLNNNSFVGKGVRVAVRTFVSAFVLGVSGALSSLHSTSPHDLKATFVGLAIAAGSLTLHAVESYVRNALAKNPAVVPAPAPKK